MESVVEPIPTPPLRSPDELPCGECYAAHPSDSTSACSHTVHVAFSCLSGG